VILLRFIHHMKNPYWTAVFLDFVMVAVGVFIGLRVNYGNPACIQRVALDRPFTSLRVEMQDDLSTTGA
jgi:hypothetical protein